VGSDDAWFRQWQGQAPGEVMAAGRADGVAQSGQRRRIELGIESASGRRRQAAAAPGQDLATDANLATDTGSPAGQQRLRPAAVAWTR
jgi:hypothetical protein